MESPLLAPSNTSAGSSQKSLVEDPYYREYDLAEKNIYLRTFYEEFPEDIAKLVDHIRQDRDSPSPSLDQLYTDLEQLEIGAGEPEVEDYFKANIFPDAKRSDSLQRSIRNPIARDMVPDVGSTLKVSTPVPNMLYGYGRVKAFPHQQAQMRSLRNDIVANTEGLVYPFFIIQFKADGPGGCGSLWAATNQCLGSSASCVNIVEHFNRRLKQNKLKLIGNAVFSIAMNGTEARIYISWKHDELNYYMQKIKVFVLQEPEQYIQFRKYTRNIIDWGRDKRLKDIRDSLDNLFEEDRKRTSRVAKSRPSPSEDPGNSRSRKRKASPKRNSSTRKRKASRKGYTSDHNSALDV
jgi:hypothetical protein